MKMGNKCIFHFLIQGLFSCLPKNPKHNPTIAFNVTFFAQCMEISVFSPQLYKMKSTLSLEL